MHGCYLGGVYYAIQGGMPSGITSLIVGLQPLVTALAAVVILRESITLRQWVGLSLGLLGVSLVLMEKLGGGPGNRELSPVDSGVGDAVTDRYFSGYGLPETPWCER
ncbi:MAG: DMT family transporter [Marinobacter sp.]|nr:DMT family transporter [Marinobacter sp.]